ncbi:MAG: hypothetical protein AAGC63_00290 [Propionicimonas sp.]|nr:hypothetical protein [Propionicimonas sp.]
MAAPWWCRDCGSRCHLTPNGWRCPRCNTIRPRIPYWAALPAIALGIACLITLIALTTLPAT